MNKLSLTRLLWSFVSLRRDAFIPGCRVATAVPNRRLTSVVVIAFLALLSVARVEAKTNTTTTLASSLNPSTYQASVTFTATVSPTAATGTVTFKDGSTTLGTGTLSGGTAQYSSVALAIGSHSITASYGGDNKYNSSTSSPLTQTVNRLSTTTTLTSSPNPSTYQAAVTFTATVSPSGATGTVTFSDSGTTRGTATLSGGIAYFITTALEVGSHPITASYERDTNYGGSISSVLTQVVNGVAPHISGLAPERRGYWRAGYNQWNRLREFSWDQHRHI